MVCQDSAAVIKCAYAAEGDCFKNDDGQLIKAGLQKTYRAMNDRSRGLLDAWWTASSAIKNFGGNGQSAINLHDATLATVKVLSDAIDIAQFVELASFTAATVEENWSGIALPAVWQHVMGVTFRHHLLSMFETAAVHEGTDPEGRYESLCTNKRLKKKYFYYDATRAETDVDYELADRFLCHDITTAAYPFAPLVTDGGLLYLIVESRFTGNAFNRAFFPCSTHVTGKGAGCQRDGVEQVYDFHHIDRNVGQQAMWTRLATLQALPPPRELPRVEGVLAVIPPLIRQQGMLISRSRGAIEVEKHEKAVYQLKRANSAPAKLTRFLATKLRLKRNSKSLNPQ